MRPTPNWCHSCGRDKLRTHYGFACPKCGKCEFLCDSVPFIENIWMKKKSQHSRMRWLEKVLRDKFIDWDFIQIICNDFRNILQVMMKRNIIEGRNLSRYDYLIIRIITRNKLSGYIDIDLFRDLKKGRTRDVFDDRLFGDVYHELGWDINCVCPYFLEWKEK